MKRPVNHVTRALDAFRGGPVSSADLPKLDEAQIRRLEELYPPRCLSRSETVEEHLRYCGMAELVANLRARLQSEEGEDTLYDDIDPERFGERAS